jgi:hypothetical protein
MGQTLVMGVFESSRLKRRLSRCWTNLWLRENTDLAKPVAVAKKPN